MRLYRFPYSCYARFIQTAIELAGVPCTIVDVAFGERDELATLTDGYIQVPVLVDDTGAVLTDSRRIMATLCADDPRFAALVPAGDAGPIWAYVDWASNQLEDVAFRLAAPGLAIRFRKPFEKALFVFIKERTFGKGCVDAWKRDADTLFADLQRLLAPTAATLATRPFLFGDRPTLADAALHGQLAMLDFGAIDRVAMLDPAVLAWKARLEAHTGAPPYGRRAVVRRSVAELDAALTASAAVPRTARLEQIVVRTAVEQRATPDQGELDRERGLVGDRWRSDGHPDAQVSLMDSRVAGAIAQPADWSLFGDNLLVDLDLGKAALRPGDRLQIGASVLEITSYPHLGCRKLMARFGTDTLRWMNARDHRDDRRRGVFARVVESGAIRIGDTVVRR